MPRRKHANEDESHDITEVEETDYGDDHTSLSSLTDHGPLILSPKQRQEAKDTTALVAQQDACWDGCWFAGGLHDMFVPLWNTNDNQQPTKSQNTNNTNNDDEFVRLDINQQDQEGWERLYVEILGPRDLAIAAGIIRQISEGTCPPKLPIRNISPTSWDELCTWQDAGDKAMTKQKYKKALAKYTHALDLVPKDFFVVPAEQMHQICDMLCDKAECYLQMNKPEKAGKAATAALLFLGNQEMARLQRAKAGLAMDSTPHLIQAQVDLQELLSNGDPTEEEKEQAQQMLPQVGHVLRAKRQEFEKQNPSGWKAWVDSIKAKCW